MTIDTYKILSRKKPHIFLPLKEAANEVGGGYWKERMEGTTDGPVTVLSSASCINPPPLLSSNAPMWPTLVLGDWEGLERPHH